MTIRNVYPVFEMVDTRRAFLTDLATCRDVTAEGSSDQTRTHIQRQDTYLRDQQEMQSCPGQLFSGAQQPSKLLNQFTCCKENDGQERQTKNEENGENGDIVSGQYIAKAEGKF